MTDYEAQRDGRYLTFDEQQAIPPSTPLPGWNNDVIPERPVRK